MDHPGQRAVLCRGAQQRHERVDRLHDHLGVFEQVFADLRAEGLALLGRHVREVEILRGERRGEHAGGEVLAGRVFEKMSEGIERGTGRGGELVVKRGKCRGRC